MNELTKVLAFKIADFNKKFIFKIYRKISYFIDTRYDSSEFLKNKVISFLSKIILTILIYGAILILFLLALYVLIVSLSYLFTNYPLQMKILLLFIGAALFIFWIGGVAIMFSGIIKKINISGTLLILLVLIGVLIVYLLMKPKETEFSSCYNTCLNSMGTNAKSDCVLYCSPKGYQ